MAKLSADDIRNLLKKSLMETYFKNNVEYPRDIAANPAPLGTCYEYVSSTFLDGFINYVQIVDAFALNRYREEEEFDAGVKDFLNQGIHTKIFTLRDDVMILAKTEEAPGIYIYFYYDMDCSDCEFGRFKTDDPSGVVSRWFEELVQDRVKNMPARKSVRLPADAFKGWISG